MPRKLSIQYSVAMFRAMTRRDRREKIILDDVNRQDFVKTQAGACQKTGWQVHSDRRDHRPRNQRLETGKDGERAPSGQDDRMDRMPEDGNGRSLSRCRNAARLFRNPPWVQARAFRLFRSPELSFARGVFQFAIDRAVGPFIPGSDPEVLVVIPRQLLHSAVAGSVGDFRNRQGRMLHQPPRVA